MFPLSNFLSTIPTSTVLLGYKSAVVVPVFGVISGQLLSLIAIVLTPVIIVLNKVLSTLLASVRIIFNTMQHCDAFIFYQIHVKLILS